MTFCGDGYNYQNAIFDTKIEALTLEAIKLLLHTKGYHLEAINTILWFYELKNLAENFNELKVDDNGITPIDKFAGTTTDITVRNPHKWGCPVYVLDAILQGNTAGYPT